MSLLYNRTNVGFTLANAFKQQAKGCLGFACGILTGVALASTLVIMQQSDKNAVYRRELECVRLSFARNVHSAALKQRSRKKKCTKRRIRFADEVDKKLVHVREFVKGSPVHGRKSMFSDWHVPICWPFKCLGNSLFNGVGNKEKKSLCVWGDNNTIWDLEELRTIF